MLNNEMDEALIEKIVRLVIESLRQNGMLKSSQPDSASGAASTTQPDRKKADVHPKAAPKGRRVVITEETIRDCVKKGQAQIIIPPHSVITPSARDAAKEKGVELIFE